MFQLMSVLLDLISSPHHHLFHARGQPVSQGEKGEKEILSENYTFNNTDIENVNIQQ